MFHTPGIILTLQRLCRKLARPSLWLTSLINLFILFFLLFCVLQTVSLLFFQRHVTTIEQSLHQENSIRERLTLLDKARIELLSASDNSHRAGIYLMQDQQSGSVDSWKSLATTAQEALKKARLLFTDYHAAEKSQLAEGFMLLSSGLQEQLNGLEKNDINAFFMVPMQAFQQQFNNAWLDELNSANKELNTANHTTLTLLWQSRDIAILTSVLLIVLLVLAALLMVRGLLLPLKKANLQLNKMATGNLLEDNDTLRYHSLETRLLFQSITTMRQGIRQIICDITAVAESIASGAEKMQHNNQHIMLQHQRQNANFHHLSQRLHRVSEEVETGAEFSQQASLQANSADQLMQDCALEVDNMEHQMQRIVSASGDIAGIVDILDSLSLQTRLLALNAAIESSHAGHYGRSFSVVAKEIGLLSERSGNSTRDIDHLIQDTQHHISHGFNKVQTLENLFAKITNAVSAVVNQLNELEKNTAAQSHRVSKIAQEVVQMSEQLQQSEQHHAGQVEAAIHLRQLSDRLAQRAQQFRIEAHQ